MASIATKRAFPKEMKLGLKNITSDAISKESKKILERIIAHPDYTKATKVSIFLNMPGEVETTGIVREIFNAGI
jgi:5-formyltetrahydrofolate cyclo-ligase